MAFTFSLAVLLALGAAIIYFPLTDAQSPPGCLNACLDTFAAGPISTVCTNSLPRLLTCLNVACPAPNPDASEGQAQAISRYRMTYSPKRLYSCQQNLVPGLTESETDPTTLMLSGSGECASSPYRFGSFIPASSAEDGLQDLRGVCAMMVYPEVECGGVATRIPMRMMSDERCVFRGGRSARLACAGDENEAALSYIASLCDNSTLPTEPGPLIPTSTSTAVVYTITLPSSTGATASSPETSTTGLVIPVVSANGTVYATSVPQSPTSNGSYTTEGPATFEGTAAQPEDAGGLMGLLALAMMVVFV